MNYGKMLLAAVAACCLSLPVRAADEQTLTEIFEEIPAQYIYGISRDELASLLLKGLKGVDGNLAVGDDGGRFTLYYNGKVVRSVRKPEEDTAAAWVQVSATVLDLAAKVSAKAAEHEFELADLALQEAVKSLDKDSKFYLTPEDMKAGRQKHRRNFAARMEGENLYIKLGALNINTRQNIEEALHRYPEAKGIVLDLRESPGGNLSEAVDTADLFLDEGIVASRKSLSETVYYNSKDGDVSNGKPLAVLVDGGTASASEVLAAALQEQGRAKVIGSGTYGKGTIQNLIHFSSGSVLALTSAFLYTPSGFALQNAGVIPNVCTFAMPDYKDIAKLVEQPMRSKCQPEKRENSPLELDTAAFLLKERQNL